MLVYGLLIVAFIALGGFILPIEADEKVEKTSMKKLNTVVLKEEEWPVILAYTGNVKAKETKNYAFMTTGRLKEVYVKKGDFIKAGSVVASVDIDYIEYPDRQNIHALKESIEAGQVGVQTLGNQVDSARILYGQGGISKQILKF